ncbi:MAG: 30S ribosomal protein S12 methylthiotransferase RimO [Eubacterium sp.]|nr:30S ribosomal protein S12 methylthiotransferase RimO [Eubacterium sp.]
MHVYFDSLGCDKNLVDSEKMLALLDKHRAVITDDPAAAEVIIVNTCAFILDAKQESIETVLELAEYKKNGKCRALIVTGCLAERYTDEIRDEIPEVDAVIGTTGYDSIWEAVVSTLNGKRVELCGNLNHLPAGITDRIAAKPGPYRYLKIAEGCNKHCTYCAIPSMRGPYRSVPMEELVTEAISLANAGAAELILVAQETTLYGVDLYGEKKLPELLKKLCRINGIEWIRLLYCYPEEITEELLRVMHDEPKICHYLDIPLQHGDDEILRRMGRKTDRSGLRDVIATIRRILPDVALRTTFISGFPGETVEQHNNSLEFVREMRFDRLGVFPYSEEEGTPAAAFSDTIDDEVRRQRADEIMRVSEEIIFQKNNELVGHDILVLVEGYLPEDECYVGRSYRDAPDIDGYVFFKSDAEWLTSDIVPVTVTKANGYDLIGEERSLS